MQLGLVVLAIINVVLLLILLLRKPTSVASDADAIRETMDRTLREQFAANRAESADAGAKLRNEVNVTLGGSNAAIVEQVQKLRGTVEERVNSIAADARHDAQELRKDAANTITTMSQQVTQRLGELNVTVATLGEKNEQRLDAVRAAVETRLTAIQTDNAAKLEQMRATVDEKLQSTLETRLGESFRLVSDQLETVYRGLGEMQTVATGVGDLKKLLTNVKTRGVWAEGQLEDLLTDILTAEQYGKNVVTKHGSRESVEFAVRLPGEEPETPVWIPIDAKFPREDYERLMAASEQGDAETVALCADALEKRILAEAKSIREKYIDPPHTTDFAIMFLPTEGLFSEVLRRPGLWQRLVQQEKVVPTGPTTLSAILSSYRLGFRTLAIQQRSSEVWEVLRKVKTQFGRFGEVLDKVQKKLEEASNTVEYAQVRSRAVEKQLKGVEELPNEQKALPGIEIHIDEEDDERASAASTS
jgi:DNA recombination protein RmuC